MDITAEVVQWLLNQGVAVFALVWFMTRLESRLTALEQAVREAGITVSRSGLPPGERLTPNV